MIVPKPQINKITDDLYLIVLSPPLKGFADFIGSWLYRGKTSFIVDVGPSSTGDLLLEALDNLKVDHLDYILLTHIHLDHAGAIGQIAKSFPKTPIICHQRAIPHLTDPSRLWEGSQKVLGTMALGYGPPTPVDGRRLIAADKFQTADIQPLITPGHAPHHVSYLTEEFLYAGETGGVFLSLAGSIEYLRPATPPRFFFNTAIQSLDALISAKPTRLCYGHFGFKDEAVKMLQIHREQLFFWKTIIKDELKNSKTDNFIEACVERLLKADSLMASFHDLPDDVQEREKYFIKNSIKGYWGYLKGD